jgi:tetratricopeptide (TPR) repeat protein
MLATGVCTLPQLMTVAAAERAAEEEAAARMPNSNNAVDGVSDGTINSESITTTKAPARSVVWRMLVPRARRALLVLCVFAGPFDLAAASAVLSVLRDDDDNDFADSDGGGGGGVAGALAARELLAELAAYLPYDATQQRWHVDDAVAGEARTVTAAGLARYAAALRSTNDDNNNTAASVADGDARASARAWFRYVAHYTRLLQQCADLFNSSFSASGLYVFDGDSANLRRCLRGAARTGGAALLACAGRASGAAAAATAFVACVCNPRVRNMLQFRFELSELRSLYAACAAFAERRAAAVDGNNVSAEGGDDDNDSNTTADGGCTVLLGGALVCLGAVLKKQKQLPAAAALLRRALALYTAHFGVAGAELAYEVSTALNSLGGVEEKSLRPAAALALYRRAEAIRIATGADVVDVIQVRDNIADVLLMLGTGEGDDGSGSGGGGGDDAAPSAAARCAHLQEAEAVCRANIAARTKEYGDDHLNNLSTRRRLSLSLRALGRNAAARAEMEGVASAAARALGADSAKAATARALVAEWASVDTVKEEEATVPLKQQQPVSPSLRGVPASLPR